MNLVLEASCHQTVYTGNPEAQEVEANMQVLAY